MDSSLPIPSWLFEHTVTWVLVVFRVAGVFAMAPLLTSVMVPMRYKALLSVLLAAGVFPVLSAQGVMRTPVEGTSLFGLVPMVAGEAMVGLVIGTIAAIPLLMLEMAGVVSGTTMGLGLARVYNPESEADTDLLGQLLFFLGMGIFFAAGGIDMLFAGILSSFERLPPGGFAAGMTPVGVVVAVLTSGFEMGIRVSMPVVGVVLLILVVLGVLGKTLPQINTMSVGFSIKMLCGIAMLALGVYAIREPVTELVQSSLQDAGAWLESLGGGAHGR
jgi:flagellar biosynthesis protein FliR